MDFNDKTHLKSTFSSNSYSGLSWFHKISPTLPDVRFAEKDINLTIQNAGNIFHNGRSIFIEECEEKDITDKDLENLNKFDRIMTPSIQISNYLSDKLGKEIYTAYKPWPYTEGAKMVPIDEDYILVFNRNIEMVRRVLGAHDGKLKQKIVLVGARGNYPGYVFPVNEYLPYKGLIYLIQKAKLIIDFGNITEYDSGLLRLCMAIGGGTVISNNWKTVEYTDGGIYLISDEEKDNKPVISVEKIKESIEDALQRTSVPDILDDYLVEYKEMVKFLFNGF
ncbi:MAG: hypothetical protein HC877_22485 [Thioploca sp.]|nr:hypothetical protein [Thioploca sp.]